MDDGQVAAAGRPDGDDDVRALLASALARIEQLEARLGAPAPTTARRSAEAPAPSALVDRRQALKGAALVAGATVAGLVVGDATPAAAATPAVDGQDGGAFLLGLSNHGSADTILTLDNSGSGFGLAVFDTTLSSHDPFHASMVTGVARAGRAEVGVYGIGTNTAGGVRGEVTGTGIGVHGKALGNVGVYGEADTSYGVSGSSNSNVGVYGSTAGSASAGVWGQSTASVGVHGKSTSNVGVYGEASTSYGVSGNSTSNVGVFGQSGATTGVYGSTTSGSGSSTGVTGTASTGTGVKGTASSGVGVSGTSTSAPGVEGLSTSGVGVHGRSPSNVGVYGESTDSYAVSGVSTNNVGVFGQSSVAGIYGTTTSTAANVPGVQGVGTAGYGVEGTATTGVGVYGSVTSGVALGGVATTGGGLRVAAPKYHVLLANSSTRQAPTADTSAHQVGELVESSAGDLWQCVAAGSPGTWRKVGGPATAGAFHVLAAPARVYDSRAGSQPPQGPKTKLSGNVARTIDCTVNSSGVPAGATAVLVTVLLVNAANANGNLTIWANGVARPQSNTIVWGAGSGRYTTSTVSALDASAKLQVSATASTDLVLDIVGYYR